ncbi:hypothetical protein [Thysanoplusia orichalcea nucleopolyhedrovirus]|uniref:Uncharacterized protein n=1 Tax=Thysanoplusia orichalcea nucleopolyhedrovirus TaxID=101850 RepID=L0CLR6_9ABAC|nr:hypothetical protein [Thysanoplusia orichalcea nucleopolyhedrovirus]AGA16263.1 hypothetical protein [Thysanoplusia orichalcea nucleopolyhedrovirus]
MATVTFKQVLLKFKLDFDFNKNLKTLIDFATFLHNDKSLSPEKRVCFIIKLCKQFKRKEMEDLRDNLLRYHRLCTKCNSLHAPTYETYQDLFCKKCGYCLCIEDYVELGLYEGEMLDNIIEENNLINNIKCAYCK